MPMKFSVLIAVYAKETPTHLEQSLESIFHQDLPPDEVVLVEDGPLTADLDEVVARFKAQHEALQIVKLPQNQGLGLALKVGLTHCQYDIVARMDSDDLSKPHRFSKEMAWLEAHPETDVVGSWTDEFADTSGKVISTRRVPETHEALLRFSRYRNPMNHPTVMFRKAAVDRLSPQLYNRRGGKHYILLESNFQRWMHKVGHISRMHLAMNITARTLIRMIPDKWRKYGYLIFLRRQ